MDIPLIIIESSSLGMIQKEKKGESEYADEMGANAGKQTQQRFYTSAGNPVKEILLKLNLPDHRILKDGGEALVVDPTILSSQTELIDNVPLLQCCDGVDDWNLWAVVEIGCGCEIPRKSPREILWESLEQSVRLQVASPPTCLKPSLW
ncbi:hypothetical protein Tco_1078567 [Tanacetum coccineum]|uniref:Uncharacterized protein n=1 Tax=Tanacetum coccineum TaxID=301880 RepID=A0ABQ5HQW6_9ASTR